jgi:type IV pilus assembly protein PilY1
MNSYAISKHFLRSAALTTVLSVVATVAAEDIPISDTPLFLSTSVAPNVFFQVDDSGSMDWSILTRSHWHFCAYDDRFAVDEMQYDSQTLAVQDCGWRVTNGLWNSYDYGTVTDGNGNSSTGLIISPAMTYRYIYDNTDNAYSTSCNDSGDNATLQSCSGDLATSYAYGADWRILSADFNLLYYNPNVTYAPWEGPCLSDGTVCSDASFSAARSDPREGKTGYSLSKNLNDFVYEVWVDDKGYSGNRPHRGADHNDTNTPNGEVDLWDKHISYTFQGNTVQVKTTTYAPGAGGQATITRIVDGDGHTIGLQSASTLNPTTTTTTLSGSGCFTELYPSSNNCRTIAEAKQNIANWYQYYRKRAFVAKSAIASVVNEYTDYRYGLSVINSDDDLFVEMPAANVTNFLPHIRSMLGDLFDLTWPTSGTPLRQGLEHVGQYYAGELSGHNDPDPIIGSCQKNYAILFTDGYWNGDAPSASIGDEDGDGHDQTLADVAYYYHEKDQQMVTYTVAFGVQGNLQDTDVPADGWPDDANGDNLKEDSNWGNPLGGSSPAKIDDLWHAAFDSNGKYTSAETATEVAAALKGALQNIEQRNASAAAVALDTGLIGSASNIYQAQFDSTDWSGTLSAIPIDAQSGIPDTANPVWEASNVLKSWRNRTILTHSGTAVNGGGAAFRWDDLSLTQKDTLRNGLTGTSAQIDAAAEQRLDYLRGDDNAETRKGGTLRDRPNGKLGDMVNSAPIFASHPAFPYPDTLETTTAANNYAQFQQDYEDRTKMVYVGANDGMLHGFDADTGEELLAYVPNVVFDNLADLTDPDYSHRFYVDGTPTEGDAFFDPAAVDGNNKSWHSVLAGGLNKGGQAIYALDVTNPDNFGETNTATVLWEFSDADDVAADNSNAEQDMQYALGDTFSRPAIVRMYNGQWAVVFGNGYNNMRNDDHASVSGDAVLYIVDIGTGEIIRKISTQTGAAEDPLAYIDANGETVYRHRANGLATTAPVDVDADHKIDYIYAGDLFGNLWKFDVRDSDPANWGVAFKDNTSHPLPLFTACAGTCTRGVNANYQPITSRPEVGRSPDRYGLMVYFGTGKYLATEDITDNSVQSFYALLDMGTRITGNRPDVLTEQTITQETNVTTNGQTVKVRSTSSNDTAGTSGWFIDLKTGGTTADGERVVQTPLLRSGRIFFSTLIPTSDICGYGGSSWLMEMNAYNGNPLATTPFALDGGANTSSYSGISYNELISTPTIINAGDKEYNYTSGSSGEIKAVEDRPSPGAFGRQSWRQLR